MIQTGFESRVKVQQIVESQLPSFILEESPNAVEFLKQYYISQEYQGGPIDITDNLDQYLKLDHLAPEAIVNSTTLSTDITDSSSTIEVSSTKGFPSQYGLFKIDGEIITYTGITTNSFTGCIRGFSGITDYHQELNQENLVFSTSTAASHTANSTVQNLSSLFLKEFYKKLKYTFTPGFENLTFIDEVDAGNFIKHAKNFYESKGTDDSIRILFNVLFGETPTVVNLEEYLIKPSSSNYVRREIVVAEAVSGDPLKLVGQTVVRSTDPNTSASISSVEIFTRKGKTYYQLELFVGYDDQSAVQGTFIITPNTKALETVSVGSSILSVDSTIGFANSGTIISGTNSISYTGKTVNQFLGCTGVGSIISPTDNVRSGDTYFSYENGDTSKKVEMIFFGVLDNLVQTSDSLKIDENDFVYVRNYGDKIKNDSETYKEIFANSWIYNTATRYEISDNSNLTLSSTIDRSSLKVGDEVEILERGTENIVTSSGVPYIESVNTAQNSVTISNLPTLTSGTEYDVRRKINKASSSSAQISFGNNNVLSDVLNLYSEKNDYAYVASNSLPSGTKTGINTTEYRYNIDEEIKSVTVSNSSNFEDLSEGVYSTIALTSSVPFVNGDKVYYKPVGDTLIGLTTGYYYTEIQSNPQKFKLYAAPAFIGSSNYLTFDTPTGIGTHTFTLHSQQNEKIGVQKLLRKFPLQKNIKGGTGEKTVPGSTGMLINGVEINNYKSTDKVYYGPLSAISVLNGGKEFDVINPPVISVSSGTAKIQPVVSGTLKKVYVDSQNYDVDRIVSTNVTGGNGSGAVIEPVLAKRVRNVSFDSRALTDGGGVSTATNQIVFLEEHNFVNGEEIVYSSQGNAEVSIGITNKLVNNASYFVQVDNNSTVTLYNTLTDQTSKTNPVGLFSGSNGTHKFSTAKFKNVVSYVKVVDEGSGYTNRKLVVKPAGISTTNDTINFNNHGFSTGELVTYSFETTQITGVSTTNQYYVLKEDDNSFRICDAGVGGTTTSNFDRGDYLKFTDTGSGYQYFSYPDISVSITYVNTGIGSTTQQHQELVTTPVVKGSLASAYLYEAGTGYGSTIVNFEKKPTITIKNGKQGEVTPVVINGSINSANVTYGGLEYNSVPDLVVEDSSGSGSGAELRALISGGKISSVKVISAGIGYSATSTKIKVVSSGKNSVLDVNIRPLTVNDGSSRFSDGEVLLNGDDGLSYSVSKYFTNLRTAFNEETGNVSNIIGWAYDGNPIYGPFGHTDPEDLSSGTKTLESGYELITSNVVDRPSGFTAGYFVEDYTFNNSGDLDEYNGRFEKTAEFPNGVYAYHATLNPSDNVSPEFPYFIGNEYHSKLVKDVDLNQTFDFNNSVLHRNTFPYKVSESGADYDFINEIDDVTKQQYQIESVTSGFISSINIENAGTNYKVNDKLIFDEEGTSGSSLDVKVSSVKGKEIVDLTTTFTENLDAIFTWEKDDVVKVSVLPKHTFSNLDYVSISGFTTTLSNLNKDYRITVPSYANGTCLSTVTSAASVGFTTEIYVSPVPEQISVGSSIGIGTETLRVLGIHRNENIIRIERGLSGVAHSQGTSVTFIPDSFTISENVDYFESRVNDKVFFNPRESLGVGTITGVSTSVTFDFGDSVTTRDIIAKGVFLESHPFITNQQVTYASNGTNVSISTDGSTTFTMPSTVYVVKKNKNLIGIKTQIGSPEVFFHTNGDNDDRYSFESTYSQVLGDIQQSKATVSVSTSHGLSNGDVIKLEVNPNLSVGIGTSTAVRVLYKSDINSVVINPIGFNSTGINTTTNIITISDHGLKTGDKIYFEDTDNASLDKNYFYVYRINSNKINICETYKDCLSSPPTVVSIANTGGSNQSISLINPQILSVENNSLVFDLTDTSLDGYQLKVFSDKKFNNEFVSIGNTTSFVVSGVGTVGVSTNASLTLEYNTNIPKDLYYTLENDGVLLPSDDDVINNSSIKFVGSFYDNSYSISGVGTTTFTINLTKKPEKLSYVQTECDTLEYSTASENAQGAVKELQILDSGSGYKKLPTLKSTNSVNGKDLIVSTLSNTIGNLNQTRGVTDNFVYSPDFTLRPQAEISPLITVKDSNTISSVSVVNAGDGFTKAPTIVIVNSDTRDVIDSGTFDVKITGTSIQSVDVSAQPKGLPDKSVELFTKDNTNGISVQQVQSGSTGIFTCIITTPTNNGITSFTTQPFQIGDKVFAEGIQKYSTDGQGFNSSDYGYRFLEVTNYIKGLTVNDQVVLSISGLGTNTGIAKTIQDSTGILINQNSYPTFTATQSISEFLVGEKLSSNSIVRDLVVVESNQNLLKVSGSYNLSIGEKITGAQSGNVATISKIELNEGEFIVNYANNKNLGWDDEIGKLNEDFQVTPNNDYFQNLSYTIKSSKTWEEQESVVNNLVHVSGLKNFADVGITTATAKGADGKSAGIKTAISDTNFYSILIDEKRVDAIYDFDNVLDIDVVDSKSKFLKLENKKLTDYIELRSNDVLAIDDISDQFSNSEADVTSYVNLVKLGDNNYENYIFRVTNSDNTEVQFNDLTIINDGTSTFILDNEFLANRGTDEAPGEEYGTFDLHTDSFNDTYLRFNPDDPNDTDYDIKLIKQTFNGTTAGVGTTSIGFIDLTGSINIESTGTGISTIISLNSGEFESLYLTAHVVDNTNNDANYVKLLVSHNGSDSFISEYYADSEDSSSFSGNAIGTFGANLSGGVLSITHTNDTNHEVEIKSNIVGFGTTAVGVGTYRFITSGQTPGNERSVVYEAKYYDTVSAASTTVLTLDKNLFNASKSFIEVSIGSTKALHQVLTIHDNTDVYTHQLPFLSVATTDEFDTASGVGTFGGDFDGDDLLLTFYPDSDQTGDIDISVFSKSLYTTIDIANEPDDLVYGRIDEELDEKFYNSINGDRINKFDFKLTTNGTPIFAKTFNPNSVALASTTGVFSIKNHFFRTGEELIYTPNSTFVGVGTSAMRYNATDELPTTVFAIKLTNDTFKVALTESDANAGTGVTFTTFGEGNAHRFTMAKRSSKSIISLDNLVQYPIAATKITHELSGNGGQIGTASTIFTLSGISTISPKDILKINDEYMEVTNVGLGTTNVGPITNTGSENLVLVKRGFVGTSATAHTDSTTVRVHKGAFNIVDSTIYFTDAPRGNPQIDKTDLNLDYETSEFNGRVFLRNDYSGNQIYDDISDEFTGIGRTFTLLVGGANTTGLGSTGGSGIVFVNNIFQTPTTNNNANNNYEINEDTVAGITTIIFSGLTKPDIDPLEFVVSDYDINQNETPRGGIIVSLGSTPGSGFAPLVGASVTAVVGAGGSIVSVGLGTTDNTGSGYNGLVSIGISVFESGHVGDVASLTATVGAGGTLSFTVGSGGTGYANPQIFVNDPSYENLPVTGVSRLSVGATTDTGTGLLLDVKVGPSTAGIGSTFFEVTEFKIARQGYAFRRGDVIKPIGLVTDRSLSAPLSEFEITVLDTYSDNFAAWEFGQLDYIDSVKNYQDGSRVRFPLFYNGDLLSFEPATSLSPDQELENLLLIFVNGVLQEPGVSYKFTGGTSFIFTSAPKVEDNIAIFFYRGVTGTDSTLITGINQTLKVGDNVQVLSNNAIKGTVTQDERTIFDLSFSDKIETDSYNGVGIDETNVKPLTWIKQKVDRKINGENVYKSRDSLESLVFPTARIIGDLSTTDNQIFVDNAEIFDYEDDKGATSPPASFAGLVVNGISTIAAGNVELITNFVNVSGFSGIVTGITTTSGTGSHPLALEFSIHSPSFSGIDTGYPVYVFDTRIGTGVTSVDDSNAAVVGIGTTFLDSVYKIAAWSSSGTIGIITCNVDSGSPVVGLSSIGSIENPVGKYSWGRLSNISGGLTRSSSPISIGVTGNTVAGLSTYPTIQRRNVSLRDTGALPKIIL
jgi:hypothetical protein